MLVGDKIWMAQGEKPCCLLLNQANRHGLIAGASGTGKTVTLKVLAEGFSQAGVPVFMADVKGDVTGMAQAGEMTDFIRKRCQDTFNLKEDEVSFQGAPVRIWDMLGDRGIPVRVTGFCSLHGYTVLRVLKDFGDKNGEHRVFDYFAAGWNRDGLALRGMGELMKSAPADKHLLILLTDASPNDSHKILPSGKIPLSRDYDGQPGIDDTAAEVRALRAQGIRVAAVFMGENTSVPAANAIYGRDLARIRRIDQLAAAAGRLIQDEIRELSG